MHHVLVDDAVNGFLRNPTEEGFVRLFRKLYAPLCRYFIVRGTDAGTAEELVQDVLLTVYRRSGDLRDHSRFTGWLFQVARNCMLQHARKRRTIFESFPSRDTVELCAVRAPDNASEFFTWMEALEPDEREICRLRYLDDLDYQSIAESLDLPMGTVKWKLHQIKKKIAAQIAARTTAK